MNTGILPCLMQQMYQAVAMPKMLYAADVWYTPVYKLQGGKKRRGAVAALHELTKVQCMVVIAITGGMQTAATCVLEVHTGLLPLVLALDRACHRATLRLSTLPSTHPLYAPVRKCALTFVKRHRSAMHNLLPTYKIDCKKIKEITPGCRAPNRPLTT